MLTFEDSVVAWSLDAKPVPSHFSDKETVVYDGRAERRPVYVVRHVGGYGQKEWRMWISVRIPRVSDDIGPRLRRKDYPFTVKTVGISVEGERNTNLKETLRKSDLPDWDGGYGLLYRH